ncbi:hypothetical protein HZS_1427 [Henneguya salminicola]|nr:hypothetical protein HZS_1427 [Henneguya salminicola]
MEKKHHKYLWKALCQPYNTISIYSYSRYICEKNNLILKKPLLFLCATSNAFIYQINQSALTIK